MTYPCRVWFWDRDCAISEFICDTVVHKGQRDYNCYKCVSTRQWKCDYL